MPLQNRHIRHAEHNEEFFKTFDLETTNFCDWAAIALFYSALHYLEYYLATIPYHPRGHGDRDRAFERFSKLKPIYDDYRTLKDTSEGSRYSARIPRPTDVQDLYKEEFTRIKEYFLKITPPLPSTSPASPTLPGDPPAGPLP
jgi:hypothetical protein